MGRWGKFVEIKSLHKKGRRGCSAHWPISTSHWLLRPQLGEILSISPESAHFLCRKMKTNKQTNEQKYSFKKDVNTTNKNTTSKRMSTQCTDVDTGRSGDFLLNISLTFNILPHFFRKLFCFHSGISTQKLISYRIQYGTFNLTK